MLVNITGNVVMNTTINASAVAVGTSMENFHLGGFSLTSTNCCYVGMSSCKSLLSDNYFLFLP